MKLGSLFVVLAICHAARAGDDAEESARAKSLVSALKSAKHQAQRTKFANELRALGTLALPHLGREFGNPSIRKLWIEIAGYDPDQIERWATIGAKAGFDVGARLPKQVTHTATGIVMVLIPRGTYTVGADPKTRKAFLEKKAIRDPGPEREISISRPFYVGKNEVIQGDWLRVMRANSSAGAGFDNPVESTPLAKIREFLRKTQLRLPTETEWEIACRGKGAGLYGRESEVAWYEGNRGKNWSPSRVGLKAANEFGLHDMLGNVMEWCVGNGNYYLRGGSFRNQAIWLHAAASSAAMLETYVNPGVGFRVARSP